VANHTTVFDIVILQQNFCFSIVGQKHTGVIGFFQDYVLKCLDCLWFDRKDSKERAKISQKIKEHVVDGSKLPLLLFPEGTCVNNDYCVMFKKGAFEIGATVYPIAIKYNKLFSDPFWNSRKQSFLQHLFKLLTGWAVVCDVWYLEPQTQQEGESPFEFATRVKKMIANKAGLIDVPWDGYLKYFKPSARFVEERRKIFASSLISRYSQNNLVELESFFLDAEEDKTTEQDLIGQSSKQHSNGTQKENTLPMRRNTSKANGAIPILEVSAD
jgi:glycerol-3-phosphate O-acyltransferase 3/4